MSPRSPQGDIFPELPGGDKVSDLIHRLSGDLTRFCGQIILPQTGASLAAPSLHPEFSVRVSVFLKGREGEE